MPNVYKSPCTFHIYSGITIGLRFHLPAFDLISALGANDPPHRVFSSAPNVQPSSVFIYSLLETPLIRFNFAFCRDPATTSLCTVDGYADVNRRNLTSAECNNGFVVRPLSNNTYIEGNKALMGIPRCFHKKYKLNALYICPINQVFMRDNAKKFSSWSLSLGAFDLIKTPS